jgi:hypothetical protein
MSEEWRPVPSYEELYVVSDAGGVRSARRRKGSRGNVLSQALTGGRSPRLCVVLYKDGERHTRLVHQLVLEAFHGPRLGREARHGPGGPFDNRVANLCWGSRADNMGPDRVRDGTSNRGERQWMAKLTADGVREIRRRHAAGETQAALATEYGVGQASVSNLVTGKTWGWLH